MSENRLDAQPAAVGDEPSGDIGSTSIGQVAGGSYREEAQRLIDTQIDLLFATVEQAAAQGDGRAAVRRTDRSLTVGRGDVTVEFAIEAITDVPANSDPAGAFPLGEARCWVRVGSAVAEEWVLSRTDRGSQTPSYHWLHAETGSPVTPEDIRAVVRG